MSDHQDALKREELRAFRQFAASIRLHVIPGSVRQPPEPAPDILADTKPHGLFAFELVRLNDPLELQRMKLMGSGEAIFEQAVAATTAMQQQQIAALLTDARMVIAPRAGFPRRDLCKSAAVLVRSLLELAWDYAGRVPLSSEAAKALAYADIYRYDPSDLPEVPRFCIMTGDYSRRADLTRLEQKLQVSYESPAPIDLLAYMDRSEFAFEGEIEAARAIVEHRAPTSVFRAVWLFEGLLHRTHLAYRRPKLPGARVDK